MKKIFILALLGIYSFHLEALVDGKNSVDDLKNLYQNAEYSMRIKDFAKARDAYINLLQSSNSSSIDIFYYADVCLRLSLAEKELGLFDDAEKRLNRLLKKPLPDDLLLRAKLLLAKVFQAQKKEEEAYVMLVQLQSQLPFEKWLPEERGYFVMLQDIVSEHYLLLVCQATRLFEASMYQESTQLLQELLQKVEAGKFPNHAKDSLKILNLLARAQYNSKNYGKVIALLQPKKEAMLAQEDDETLIYLAKSYKELGSLSQAKELFEVIDEKKKALSPAISLEKGHTYLLLGNFLQAEESLKKTLESSPSKKQEMLAKLYLAKTYLKNKNFKKVEETIELVFMSCFDTPKALDYYASVKYEMAYLLAESYFAMANYEKAIEFYEKSIPSKHQENADWVKSSALKIGASYLRLSEKNPKFLGMAINTFKELRNDLHIKEKASIGLGWALALKNEINPSSTTEELLALLNDTDTFYSIEGSAELILIKARCETHKEAKEELYKMLSQTNPYCTTTAGKKAWFFRAEQSLEELISIKERSNKEFRNKYENTLLNFDKSFQLLEDTDEEMASLSLLNKAQVYKLFGDKDSLMSSYHTIEKLIDSHLYESCPKKREALYLDAQLCCSLYLLGEEESYLKKAEKSLKILQEIDKNCDILQKGLFTLAATCYQAELFNKAEDLFYTFYCLYPLHDKAAESLFFASLCNERSEEEKEIKANFYRRIILENYPQSSFSQESYLRYFPFSEYIQGENLALSHLKEMPIKYPKSNLLTIAYFLLGLNFKENKSLLTQEALIVMNNYTVFDYFLLSITTFEKNFSESNIKDNELEELKSIYFRAVIEFANLALEELNQEYKIQAIYLLNKIIDLFLIENNVLTKSLKSLYAYPRVLEECQYLLAKMYYSTASFELCHKTLDDMVARYSKLNIQKSYYQTLTYFELGKLHAKLINHEKALEYFKLADDNSSNQIVSKEMKLKIWTESSNSARYLGRFDEAMLYLSFVINENISSSTRIQAMLLRSELYAIQGRHELAIKQLEAVSKNGGEFALIAKEILKENYGFE
jgi:tetratricopeptide (TPR) repeat protein